MLLTFGICLQIRKTNFYGTKIQHVCHYNLMVNIQRLSYYPFAIIYSACNLIKTTSTSSLGNPSTIAGCRFIVACIVLINTSRQTFIISFVTIHITICKLIFSVTYENIFTERWKIMTYPKVCWKEPIGLISVA